jgi:small subunit ribosomal protein S11
MNEEIKTEVVGEAPKADKKAKVAKGPVRSAKGKKRVAKVVPRGRAYIQTTLNNTIVTLTDQNGNALCWSSAGLVGFTGPKKATPYAASKVIDNVFEKAEPFGLKELSVFVIGIGSGRDSAIRSLNAKGFNVLSIQEITPMPHNGCRAPRARRV